MQSERVKLGPERAPHRSLLYATGLTPEELDRPLIGVVNSHNELVPGHVHLDRVGQAVKAGVRMAGGTPLEFHTIAVCDGVAMGHEGMRYSLPSRELIADAVETMVSAHGLDGIVLIPNCDKVVPGMLMAAARLDLPAIFVSGGPMMAGRFRGSDVDVNTVFEAVGEHSAGRMSDEELGELELAACPGCGSCAGLFTANSMNCLTEALEVWPKTPEMRRRGCIPRTIFTPNTGRNRVFVRASRHGAAWQRHHTGGHGGTSSTGQAGRDADHATVAWPDSSQADSDPGGV